MKFIQIDGSWSLGTPASSAYRRQAQASIDETGFFTLTVRPKSFFLDGLKASGESNDDHAFTVFWTDD